MRVLMLGWEFPPHITGGLGTACYGLVQGLLHHHVEVSFVIPRISASQERYKPAFKLLGANEIPLQVTLTEAQKQKIRFYAVESWPFPYGTQEYLFTWETSYPTYESSSLYLEFTGRYGPNLLQEVQAYAWAVSQLAFRESFDIIHAHDWLTYVGGIALKALTGKPLVLHIHATEFDRSGENINPIVYDIEREGFHNADKIIAVSHYTRRMVIEKYEVPPDKVVAIHNAVLPKDVQIKSHQKKTFQVVTFLGRVTYQKGPEYFVEAAARLAPYFPKLHFVMGGTGDLLRRMIEYVAHLRLGDRFHFTGFLPPSQVEELFDYSDVYVMPSVSEPFGISALEALRAGVPVILSKQSGVAEVLPYVPRVDFWDIDKLAELIQAFLVYKGAREFFIRYAQPQLSHLQWEKSAEKVKNLYQSLV
ncbi:MAG: glycosyltransferase family 4 protein [Bacteroidia bacterium]